LWKEVQVSRQKRTEDFWRADGFFNKKTKQKKQNKQNKKGLGGEDDDLGCLGFF